MISLKLIPLFIVIVITSYLAFLSFSTRLHTIKTESERFLNPCPQTPNCVSSEVTNGKHSIKPFKLIGNDHQVSWTKLIVAIENHGGEILVNDGNYCHAVFTSTLFRFKDDMEAVMGKETIAIRSASRTGKSDFGQNRQRIEKIRLFYQSKKGG